jgi:hypothetical protein
MLREIFFIFHEKVSIQDAVSFFGPGQITMRFYPSYSPRKSQSGLEVQAHSLFHWWERLEDESLIGKIS